MSQADEITRLTLALGLTQAEAAGLKAEVARLTALGDAMAAAVETFSQFRAWGDEWDAMLDAARAWRVAREEAPDGA